MTRLHQPFRPRLTIFFGSSPPPEEQSPLVGSSYQNSALLANSALTAQTQSAVTAGWFDRRPGAANPNAGLRPAPTQNREDGNPAAPPKRKKTRNQADAGAIEDAVETSDEEEDLREKKKQFMDAEKALKEKGGISSALAKDIAKGTRAETSDEDDDLLEQRMHQSADANKPAMEADADRIWALS